MCNSNVPVLLCNEIDNSEHVGFFDLLITNKSLATINLKG